MEFEKYFADETGVFFVPNSDPYSARLHSVRARLGSIL
jgi:hypothetical protein